MSRFRSALTLDGFDRAPDSIELVTQQLQTVLNTRPGHIPWLPDFGCDLESLAGEPASSSNLDEARDRVQHAVKTWVPSVEIARCDVRVISRDRTDLKHPTVPLAESAMLTLGVEASLEVLLEVVVPQGPVVLTAEVNP